MTGIFHRLLRAVGHRPTPDRPVLALPAIRSPMHVLAEQVDDWARAVPDVRTDGHPLWTSLHALCAVHAKGAATEHDAVTVAQVLLSEYEYRHPLWRRLSRRHQLVAASLGKSWTPEAATPDLPTHPDRSVPIEIHARLAEPELLLSRLRFTPSDSVELAGAPLAKSGDTIADFIEATLDRGFRPGAAYPRCRSCGDEWHGLPTNTCSAHGDTTPAVS
ncbi:hypothetical protein [Nocardia sp. IFM 10818]